MTELKMTHVLLLAVAAFLMYHFIGGCNCNRGDGFNVGGQITQLLGKGCNAATFGAACGRQQTISNNQKTINDNLDTLTNKVDTLTNRFDEFLCQIIDSEKCIDKTKIGNCKMPN